MTSTKLTKNLNVHMKTEVMSFNYQFEKGAALLGVICSLIRYSGLELIKAREQINIALDLAEEDRK